MDAHDDETFVTRGKAFGEEYVAANVEARDNSRLWDAELFRRIGDEGILSAVLPTSDGGGGYDVRAIIAFLRGLGEGGVDPGLALAVAVHLFACALPISVFGSQSQRRRYLPALGTGEWMGALAHGEVWAHGQTLGIGTRATKSGSRWILDGKKTCVVNGPVADVFVVTAITDPDRARENISVFVVDKKTRGCSVGRPIDVSGLRTAVFSDVSFDRCEVSSDNLIGTRGAYSSSVQPWIQRAERAAYTAPWIGIMRVLLDRCVTRTRANHEFGRPASQSQQVRARLANMRIEYELCCKLQSRAAWQLDHEMPGRDRDIVSSRLFIDESLGRFMRDLRAFYSIDGDSVVERSMRDANAFVHRGGGTDALRTILGASLLGLG
jgi:alkylation response protein AidB-like acyl-CoA dehydrogenase